MEYASTFSRQRGFTRFPTCISVPVTPQPFDTRTSLRAGLDAWTGSTINPLALSFCVSASLP